MRTLVASLLLSAPVGALAAGPLDLSQGTAELGGSATLNLYGGPGGGDFAVMITPQAGYFLADRVELFGGVSLWLVDGGSGVGLSVGARYVGTLGSSNHWYAGGSLGYGQASVMDVWVDDEFALSGLGGFLFPLNDAVAVDVGARLNLFLESGRIHLPIGFLGVAAFFP